MKWYSEKARQLVDDIKTIWANNGLGGEANEYKIVTQSFLYKFLSKHSPNAVPFQTKIFANHSAGFPSASLQLPNRE